MPIFRNQITWLLLALVFISCKPAQKPEIKLKSMEFLKGYAGSLYSDQFEKPADKEISAALDRGLALMSVDLKEICDLVGTGKVHIQEGPKQTTEGQFESPDKKKRGRLYLIIKKDDVQFTEAYLANFKESFEISEKYDKRVGFNFYLNTKNIDHYGTSEPDGSSFTIAFGEGRKIRMFIAHIDPKNPKSSLSVEWDESGKITKTTRE